jgi:hypothetical protein
LITTTSEGARAAVETPEKEAAGLRLTTEVRERPEQRLRPGTTTSSSFSAAVAAVAAATTAVATQSARGRRSKGPNITGNAGAGLIAAGYLAAAPGPRAGGRLASQAGGPTSKDDASMSRDEAAAAGRAVADKTARRTPALALRTSTKGVSNRQGKGPNERKTHP